MLIHTVFFLFLSVTALSKRIVLDWDVTFVYMMRDGINYKRSIGVNGKSPIPPVYATVGDTLIINVKNSLNVTTSIHAHGLFMHGRAYMDGPALTNQCGIPPGESFTYEYLLEQAGTFWLHGHDHDHHADGLRTALVIYDRELPYRYDGEHLLTFEDWFAEQFADRAALTTDPTKPFPPPSGYGYGLINGYNGNDSKPIKFEPKKTYRIRLINMSSTVWFKFQIPGFKLRVIEVDGILSDEHPVDGVQLAPAMRYSVLVTAHDSDEFNYSYKIKLYADFIEPSPGESPRFYSGVVEYKQGAPVKEIPQLDDSQLTWVKDIKMTALDRQPPMKVDRTLTLSLGNHVMSTGQHMDHINNITYYAPLVPSLFTAMTTGHLAMNPEVYANRTHPVVLKHNEVIELEVHNPNRIPHPMHLHGHAFQVTEYGPSLETFRPGSTFSPLVQSLVAPIKRDIMEIPPNSYMKIRFRADNPGVWVYHCHINIHGSPDSLRMLMTFVEAPDVLQKTQTLPPKLVRHCEMGGMKGSGNAAGNRGLDMTGLPPIPTNAA
ncbi:ferroxidase fet3 [Linderina macrospora]|uniref:Ferroxidase fet3 n=1 Tax=Linderina macrospora TaxID=4868 RepID=A0ACC1J6W4_9FUNG|nr:ferroxidase fet3 [Linderina macrospora]